MPVSIETVSGVGSARTWNGAVALTPVRKSRTLMRCGPGSASGTLNVKTNELFDVNASPRNWSSKVTQNTWFCG